MLPRRISKTVQETFDIVMGMTDNRIASGIRRSWIDILIRKAYREGYRDADNGLDRRL